MAGLFTGISAKSYRATFGDEAPSERVRVGVNGDGLIRSPPTFDLVSFSDQAKMLLAAVAKLTCETKSLELGLRSRK